MKRSEEDRIIQRLDTLIALQAYSQKKDLQARFQEIRDDVCGEILSRTDDWIISGDLKGEVSNATGKTERTVRTRMKEMRERFFLIQRKGGRNIFYKKSPLMQYVE
ncbi:MAG: hypothetical protein ACE5IO_05795 [Thermoplasmata archaeon]